MREIEDESSPSEIVRWIIQSPHMTGQIMAKDPPNILAVAILQSYALSGGPVRTHVKMLRKLLTIN